MQYTATLCCRPLNKAITLANVALCNTLQHCNTMQYRATLCCRSLDKAITLGNVALCNTQQLCNTLQHNAIYCNFLLQVTRQGYHSWKRNNLQHTATHCHTMQYTATLCCRPIDKAITLANVAIRNTQQHCNTLHHNAIHCNSLLQATR